MKKITKSGLFVAIVAMLTTGILFSSCWGYDEDEPILVFADTYIEGYITDVNTGEPVEGVQLGVLFYTNEPWGSSYDTTCYSNANGYYKIRVLKTKFGYNVCRLDIQLYYKDKMLYIANSFVASMSFSYEEYYNLLLNPRLDIVVDFDVEVRLKDKNN